MEKQTEPHKDDEALVRRAMRVLRNYDPIDQPKWVVVMHTFGLGSTESSKLCRRMDMDPETIMKGVLSMCMACGAEAVRPDGLCLSCGCEYEH